MPLTLSSLQANFLDNSILVFSALAGLTLLIAYWPRPAVAPVQSEEKEEKVSMMPPVDFTPDPPKDDPYTPADLAKHNGSDPSKPILVCVKGTVFDVSSKRDVYGPGCGYNVFAGKDASKALGKSSLDPADAISDYSELTDKELAVLDDWKAYYTKRYNVVGKLDNRSKA